MISFDDDVTGDSEVRFYFLDTDQVMSVATLPSNEFLNDISGNRVVYTSNRSGNNDVWVYEFLVEPLQAITPASGLEFGTVTVGQSAQQIATVSHPQNMAVTLQGLAFSGAAATNFSTAVSVPATIGVGQTLDVPVTFAPSATGPRVAVLELTTSLGVLQVPLSGTGAPGVVPPQQQIAAILAFFDLSVASGTLNGSGPGTSARGRRTALRNMLDAAGDLIAQGRAEEACQLLADAAARTDGAAPPPDFVTGPAAGELLQLITALRSALGCA